MREQPDHIAVIINDQTGTPIYNDNPNHVGITVDSGAVMVEIAPKGRGKNNYQVFVVIHLLQG